MLRVVDVATGVARLVAAIWSYLSATCCQCRFGPGPGVLCFPWRQVQTTFDAPVPPLDPSSAHGLSGPVTPSRAGSASTVVCVKPIMWSP